MAVWVTPDQLRNAWRSGLIEELAAPVGPKDVPPETKITEAIEDAQNTVHGRLKTSAYKGEIDAFTSGDCPRQLERFVFNLAKVNLVVRAYDRISSDDDRLRRETHAEISQVAAGTLGIDIDSDVDESDDFVLTTRRSDDATPAITLEAMKDW